MALRRSTRASTKQDYKLLDSLGTTDAQVMEDFLQIHAESDFDDKDEEVLEQMVDQESAELEQLEAQLARQQEDQMRKKKILQTMQRLQAIKDRKAAVEKALAGDPRALSASAGGAGLTGGDPPDLPGSAERSLHTKTG